MRHDVPLAPLTTMEIGGPARSYLPVPGIDRLREGLEWARSRGEPVFVLGGGSNVVISDRGFEGLVLHLVSRGIEVEEEGDAVVVRVAAGEEWDRFVAWAVGKGLAGIECLSGIPGLVGATPIQNVGAYGQEVAETIERVETVDRSTGRIRWFAHSECGFAYRTSVFKGELRDRYVVTSVIFRLARGRPQAVRYGELRRALLADEGDDEPLERIRRSVLAIRRRKGMVVDSGDPETKSDGSFFLNPVLDPEEYGRFLDRARRGPSRHDEIPTWHTEEGCVKVSAAWLIERAGYSKGFRFGGVGISRKHALAIVNRGGTAAEVRALAEEIVEAVERRFGVVLEPEPWFVGFDD